MRTLFATGAASLLAAGILVSPALGGKSGDQQPNDRAVFVTGSLIPQRIKLKRIGTTTTSPVRVIDRQEIDATGRQTTKGALVADPSVRILGR
jgi:outer membrane cobalamin receptor